MLPGPICVGCAVEMRVLKNSFPVTDAEEVMATFWQGDIYFCPGCGHRIISNFGKETTDSVVLALVFARN